LTAGWQGKGKGGCRLKRWNPFPHTAQQGARYNFRRNLEKNNQGRRKKKKIQKAEKMNNGNAERLKRPFPMLQKKGMKDEKTERNQK